MSKKAFLSLAAVAIFLLLSGCGSDEAAPDNPGPAYVPARTVTAEKTVVPRLHDAVGTVQAKTDIRVEAQVTGRVLKVLVRPGDKVNKGDDLIVLDSRASEARAEAARQALVSATRETARARDGLAAAQAAYAKAESTYKRMRKLAEQNVVTAEEAEKAESAYLQAKAALGQARQSVASSQALVKQAEKVAQEAEISLGYTTIQAPDSGEVAKRLAEPGDLAFAGKELLTLQTGGSLRLEAMVRESLIGSVHLGDTLSVRIAALNDASFIGEVEEIEPLADPVTRSFLVKVGLPDMPGLYPGMFGRLMIPLGEDTVVLVPEEAVTRVGQLETVKVKSPEGWQTIYVRTGRTFGDKVEILSGLSGDETLGIGGGE